jgi:hypothetical protein
MEVPFLNSGSPGRTRTCNLVVNSHPLLPVELPGNFKMLEVQGKRLEGKALSLKNNLHKNRGDDK